MKAFCLKSHHLKKDSDRGKNEMKKEAIKKYTEELGVGGMILHYICRFLTKAEMQIIGKLTQRFKKVKKNRLVFKNREKMVIRIIPVLFLIIWFKMDIMRSMRSSGWFLTKENSEI